MICQFSSNNSVPYYQTFLDKLFCIESTPQNMSYEYFLQAHLHGQDQPIATARIVEVFAPYITQREETFIELEFDDSNSCTIYLDQESPTTSQITISRPCADQRLGACLYEVMQLGNFVFFEPDGTHPILLTQGSLEHIPSDMIDSLGDPVIARNKEEFLEFYFNNR